MSVFVLLVAIAIVLTVAELIWPGRRLLAVAVLLIGLALLLGHSLG